MRDCFYRSTQTKKNTLNNFIRICKEKINENLATLLYMFNDSTYGNIKSSLVELYFEVSNNNDYTNIPDDIDRFYDTDYSDDDLYNLLNRTIIKGIVTNAALVLLRDRNTNLNAQNVEKWVSVQITMLEEILSNFEEQIGYEIRADNFNHDESDDDNSEHIEPPGSVERSSAPSNLVGGNSRRELF